VKRAIAYRIPKVALCERRKKEAKMPDKLKAKLRALLRKSEVERDLDEELRYHIEQQTEQNIRLGMDPEEARTAAHKAFGGVEQAKEQSRDARGVRWLEELWQDLRYGLRMLRRKPGFTVAAVLSLALGIGANSTVFTFLNAILIRPLPYPEPERLVNLWERAPGSTGANPVLPLNFVEWRDRARSFEAITLTQSFPLNAAMQEGAEQLSNLWVTSEFFRVFGTPPALGRAFTSEETMAGGDRGVVIISHDLWQRRFAGDPGVIGKTLLFSLGQQTRAVIGVMPAGFRIPSLAPDVYTPMPLDRINPNSIGGRSFICYGRLKPNVGLASAQAEMSVIAGQLSNQYPADKGWDVSVFGMHQYLTKEARSTLPILMGVTAMVLLIACANLAGLLMTNGVGRRNELAIRAALGASRSRIVRQLVVESFLLSAIGGVAGLLLGVWSARLLLLLSKDAVTFGRMDEVSHDLNVLGFTLAISAITALLFGLPPAWRISRMDLQTILKGYGRGAAGDQSHNRFRGALIIGEVALAVILLVGAGLLLRSFSHLLQVSLGFQPEQTLTMRLFLSGNEERRAGLAEQITQKVEALPAVRAAGIIHMLPTGGFNSGTGFYFDGQPEPEPAKLSSTEFSVISQGYFASMGIPLLQGRFFGSQDRRGSPRAVIVNQAFLKKYFPQGDAIGRRIVVVTVNKAPTEIVGVVGDVRYSRMTAESQPTVFLLHSQTPRYISYLVVRSTADPITLTSSIRREIQEIDKTQAIAAIKTMEQYLSESVARPRLYAILLAVFAGLALLLAIIGLYGLMAYTVSERTHEIGIRMALGGQRRDIFNLVVGKGLMLALVGMSVGVAGALALTRALTGLLFGVKPTDIVTFAGVLSLIALVSLLACYLPARRATKVDPMIALRNE
jgi:putative ABC transport system permease protein